MSESSYNPLIAGIEEIRRSWGWFLALGILFIILGMACITFDVTATFASVLIFGWMLLIGGVFALVQAFTVGTLERILSLSAQCAIPRIHRILAGSLPDGGSRDPYAGAGFVLHRRRTLPDDWLGDGEVSPLGLGGLFRHRHRSAGDDAACADAHFRHLVHWFRDRRGPRLRRRRDDRLRHRDTSRVTQNAGFSCRVNT